MQVLRTKVDRKIYQVFESVNFKSSKHIAPPLLMIYITLLSLADFISLTPGTHEVNVNGVAQSFTLP